jgi:threonine aldolase
MKKSTPSINRRDFFKKCGLSSIPVLLPSVNLNTKPYFKPENQSKPIVNFISDGLFFSPQEYLEKLNKINATDPIEMDFYGNSGSTKELEEAFSKITGKEKAIYLPTGTMANQLAISMLNGENTKIIVPENSHIYRDEADAAQSVHNKRLIPLGAGKVHFDLSDLISGIDYLNESEVFKSGLGTIAIENPVRRADGAVVPIETIEAISNHCKENGYKMHLDGARIHLASAYTNISLAKYASYFDTIYISLYKYLNANGGAILCGNAKFIDQLVHQIKIHGGTVYQNWNNTAMALHYLKGIEQRWDKVIQQATQLISKLNKINGVNISSINNGTNIYNLKLGNEISLKELANHLSKEYNIWVGRADKEKNVKFIVNESLLRRDNKELIEAWKMSVKEVLK